MTRHDTHLRGSAGSIGYIIPQIVQKEKRQARKPAASMRFREKSHPIKIIILYSVQKENSVTMMAGTHQDYAVDRAI